jgi:FlaA1/EpsC-like NDP-sugar epimerase
VLNTFILAYFIRFNFSFNFDSAQLFVQLPFVLLAAFIGFILIGSYKGIVRHTGLRDSVNIALASSLMALLMIGIEKIIRYFNLIPEFSFPISILAIHFLLNILLLIASRYLFKTIYHLFISDFKIDSRVLIYGAGDAGRLTNTVLTNDKDIKVLVLGFIDDDKRLTHKMINGITVYHSDEITEQFVQQKKVDEIIISIQQIKSHRLLEIVEQLSKLAVNVKIVPPVKSWIDGNLKSKQIQKIKIEDLLGRDPIKINNTILQKEFHQEVVLITGAAGSIGSEIARQISNYNHSQLILIDQAESDLYNLQQYLQQRNFQNIKCIVADIRNKKRMQLLFQQYQPTLVFHAAAYKHVPFMEANPYEAVCVNVFGTKVIADLSIANNVKKFVMISTDKAVNPTNVMGATKRIAELYINTLKLESNTKFIITRFGNVLGSNGSVIPLFQSQIENGGPITVTHKEITRYFMTIPEACELVLEASAMGNGGELYVFDMGKSVKIYDLALNMIRLSGLRFPEDIDIKINGLRPGEKIFEELLGDGENTIPTYHEKIMIAKLKPIDSINVKQQILDLCDSNLELNCEQTVAKMKEIVPEFISNNSEYELLDK